MNTTSNCLIWHDIDYDQQLIYKLEIMKKYFPYIDASIISSPIINFYRNKLRFDVGFDIKGNIVIGYALPKKQSNIRYVFPADDMKHLHPRMKLIIYWLQSYLNNNLKSWYSYYHNTSTLSSITIRTSFHTNDSIVIVNINCEEYDIDDIVNYFTQMDFSDWENFNFVIKFPKTQHIIIGHDYIHEKLDQYTFKISHESFFQVNTLATEVLYNTIKLLTIKYFNQCHDSNILLDLCCGTGTIATYLASTFTHVVGIDIKSSSIIDANENKHHNNIQNIDFICAPIENVLDQVIIDLKNKYHKPQIFVVIDPPRTGMHGGVQQIINECENLDHIIYVSCNIITFKRDMDILSKCFNIVETIYVDLFPHTPHCEVIMVLSRK
ncbi:putative RNA methyltransferase [Megavirus courdo11]|uniref:Putative RNA methyltransferase n=1 Tax=Megavirus courdo11 TaxID=1128140 RepID=K7YW42_9VIRU|nr:putative RNA methyltransferase [Megavirus courdo11]